MRKTMLKILAIFLASISVCSFVGCKKEIETEKKEPIDTISETNNILVGDGKTEYTIVYPTITDNYLTQAVDDLQYYFKESTGVEIQAVCETNAGWSNTAKYISLGANAILKASGLNIGGTNVPTGDAYQIKNSEQSVFINGGDSLGTLFGVYKFINYQFGFEAYSADEIALKRVERVKLFDYNVTDIPDTNVRIVGEYDVYDMGGFAQQKRVSANRMFLDTEDSAYIKINWRPFHNSFEYVPVETYYEEHKNWYNTGVTQLCYSRDVEGLGEVVIARMKKEIVNQPNGRLITVSQQDGNTWCECPSCIEISKKYGTDAATNLLFINYCAKEINRWLSAPSGDTKGSYTDDYHAQYGVPGNPNREITIGMFAYCKTQSAPVTTDGNGNTVSTMTDVELEDNLAAFVALISAHFNHSIYDEINKTSAIAMEGWGKVVKNVWAWYYSLYERNPYIPMNNLNIVKDNYKFALENGASYIFEEGYKGIPSSDWRALKTYIYSKLMWDVESDLQQLTNRFMKQYYDGASEVMLTLFTEQCEWMEYTDKILGRSGIVSKGGDASAAKYWPKNVLVHFLDKIDEALTVIAPIKRSNPNRYETLYRRILAEGISYRYLLLRNYKTHYPTEFEEMKASLILDAKMLGYTSDTTNYSMSVLQSL